MKGIKLKDTELVEDKISTPPEWDAWYPRRIILTKGLIEKQVYCDYAERIISLFPQAEVVNALDKSWMEADRMEGVGFGKRFDLGKQNLILATRNSFITKFEGINSDVRCPSFHRAHFQELCPYRCSYCYLTASTTTRVSPQVKIFVNLDKMFDEVRKFINKNGDTFFSAGELQDSLALDWCAEQARGVVEFFAQVNGKVLFLTKSDEVHEILDAVHRGHTILSWSINTDEITRTIEKGTPPLENRLMAASLAQTHGYPIRLRFDPIIPEGTEWTLERQEQYREMTKEVFKAVKPERITLGSFRAVPGCKSAHDARVKAGHVEPAVVNTAIARIGEDGRWRHHNNLRKQMYQTLVEEIRTYDAEVPIALCKETLEMWYEVGLNPSDCRCNCVEESVNLEKNLT